MCFDIETIERLFRAEAGSEERQAFQRHTRLCEKCGALSRQVGEKLLLEQVTLEGGHPDASSLSAYLDHEGVHAEPLVALHVEKCDYCTERLESMRRGRVTAASLPLRAVAYEPSVPPLSTGLRSSGWPLGRPAVAAAAFGVLAVIAVLGYRQVTGAGSSHGTGGASPSMIVEGPKAPGTHSPAPAPEGSLLANDGAVRIARVDGAVRFQGADASAQSLYSTLWRDGKVTLPEGAKSGTIHTLGSADPGEEGPGKSQHPAPNAVLIKPKVEFRWPASQNSDCTLEVYTADQKVKPLCTLRVRGTKATISLPAGKEYTYIVQSGGGEVVPETGFRILSTQAADEITRVEQQYPQSHLLLASVYARHGLSAKARQHLAEYVSAHPKDPVAVEIGRQLGRD